MWYYRIWVQPSAWSINQEKHPLLNHESSLNPFPRSGKTSELKVMTNQLQANYKPRYGCRALPLGIELKIFWHERNEHHLSLACLLQDVYVCMHMSVWLRLKWMSCLGFQTELTESSGFILDWGAPAQETTIWHDVCSGRRHCPWPREREVLKKLLLIDVLLFQSYDQWLSRINNLGY